MANVKTVELWLHIHGYRNGVFEVSSGGTDSGRIEIPAHLVDRFHADASRPGKALFRVPEYYLVGIGIYKPAEAGATRTVRPTSQGSNVQELDKAAVKPIFDESALYREIAKDVLESHNENHGGPVKPGYLESPSVIRSPGEQMKRDAAGAFSS